MIVASEHGNPVRRLVRTAPIEHAGAVVQSVGQYVDRRVRPGHQLSVAPDKVRLFHRRSLRSLRTCVDRCVRRDASESPVSAVDRLSVNRPLYLAHLSMASPWWSINLPGRRTIAAAHRLGTGATCRRARDGWAWP